MDSRTSSKRSRVSLLRKFSISHPALSGYFENETLGDIKNSKEKQKEIVSKVTAILSELKDKREQVKKLRAEASEPKEFFRYETVRAQLSMTQKELVTEEKDLRKLSCRIADFTCDNVVDKFSDLLTNTFILRKSYTSTKFVHYFEWGQKYIHFFDVEKCVSSKVTINNEQIIPKFCRTVVTDEGKVFCIGGRH